MPNPSKPVSVLRAEGKSHRTRAELEQREKAEDALLSGVPMREWPDVRFNRTAHANYLRIRKLLKNIGKDDALYEAVMNRYCQILAEVDGVLNDMATVTKQQELLDSLRNIGEIDAAQYFIESKKLIDMKLALERALAAKRKMLLDIERENIMTIAAAQRTIPKTLNGKKDAPDMDELLERRVTRSV